MRLLLSVLVALLLVSGVAPAALAGDTSVSQALVEVLKQKGVIDDDSYNDLKKAGEVGGAQAIDKKLIDILHAKGVIDDASYNQLSAQAEAEKAAAPVSPQASPAGAKTAEAARPLEKALASIEEGIARLGGDTVKLKIGTWTQLGFVSDDAGSSTYYPGVANALSSTASNNFNVKYARLYFNGTIAEKLGFRVAVDAAPTSGNVLRDAYVYGDYIPYSRVTLGRFLTPFGDEVWRAPFDVPTLNYSLASTFIQIPTARSTGAMLSGKYMTRLGGLPVGAGYNVAVINGLESSTLSDDNDHKDVIGRAYVYPFLPGLSVGGSWYLGESRSTIGSAEANRDYDRWAAEFDYAPAFAKGLTLRGEYLWQRRFFTTNSLNRHAHSAGWYTTAAYRVNGVEGPMRFLNDFEPVFRSEQFDEDLAVSNDSRARETYGLNYYLNKYARLMLNYEVIHADGGLGAATLQPSDNSNVDHHVFTTNVQIWF